MTTCSQFSRKLLWILVFTLFVCLFVEFKKCFFFILNLIVVSFIIAIGKPKQFVRKSYYLAISITCWLDLLETFDYICDIVLFISILYLHTTSHEEAEEIYPSLYPVYFHCYATSNWYKDAEEIYSLKMQGHHVRVLNWGWGWGSFILHFCVILTFLASFLYFFIHFAHYSLFLY